MEGLSRVGNLRDIHWTIGKNFLADAINDLLAKIQDTPRQGVPWIASKSILWGRMLE